MLKRYLKEVTRSKKGHVAERFRIRSILRSPISQLRMSVVTSSHIAGFRDERSRTVSPGTVNRDLTTLSHAIQTARREREIYMPDYPAYLVRRMRAPTGRRLVDAGASRGPGRARRVPSAWHGEAVIGLLVDDDALFLRTLQCSLQRRTIEAVTATDIESALAAARGQPLDFALVDLKIGKEHIQQALRATDGNISAAARMLGVHRRSLQRKLVKRPVSPRASHDPAG